MTELSMAHGASPLMNDGDKSDNPPIIFDDNEFDDPLLRQLPKELHEYIVTADEHDDKLEYVHRNDMYQTIHSALSVLCCCYSLCRMVLVKQGEVGLTQNGDKPELLGPGRHILLSPFNNFVGVESINKNMIRNGPIHIIRVEMGSLGYGVNIKSGTPVILARGKHIINDINFVWKKFITLREPITQLDQLRIVRIETGKIGYSFKKGQLVILQPGLHLIEPPDRFGDIISTQMQIIDLMEAIHETSDYVPLSIKAAVFYRIVKPERALKRISNIRQQITETAVATLAGIIRSSSLSDIASRSQPFYHKGQGKNLSAKESKSILSPKDVENEEKNENKYKIPPSSPNDEPSAPPFFQHVHDEFIQQLHDHVLDEWGIEIQNIRIESLKINDQQLQQNIANQAIDVSKQHNRYLMLRKKQEIIMTEANAKAAKQQIETQAVATTIRTKAKAAADAVRIAAKAEKQALELKGQGEAEYARLLESTKLGNEMSVMRIQADALSNLDQVAYIPHLPDLLGTNGGIFGGNKIEQK